MTQNSKPKLPNMKDSSSMKNNSHNVCLPNLLMRNKAASKSGADKRVSNISIMDRLREAVLRLIMLTVISKSTPATTSNSRSPTTGGNNHLRQNFSSPSSRNDPHHSQAVAECIEFIKMKSTYYDDCVLHEDLGSGRNSSSSLDLYSPIVDESPQLPLPFSVM